MKLYYAFMDSCYVHVMCILANKLRSVPDIVLYALFHIFAFTITGCTEIYILQVGISYKSYPSVCPPCKHF